ncbi:MAG TPA: Gfo/Idh/MocA family oxidoreductase [Tepidisphaeraceae bacterium]|jgi:predicted dehydrogenase|nr:Gfo/Idh/MocA family oxidoreductase [Tepidisphaeraceae bacterium]
MAKFTRREFTKSATAAVGLALATNITSAQTKTAEPIRLGFIGVGNRGDQVLHAFLEYKDAHIVAISDLYQPYLDFAAKKIGTEVEQFKDYRKLLDRKDIDGVVIATPDHWHALHAIHAMAAGKDVYIEKPLSLTIAEGRAMVNAARRTKRVTQVGLHRRSSDICRQMIEFLRAGGIGKITAARAFHIQNEWPKGIGRPEDSDPPKELDWDAWVGPAAMKPYNKNRTLYRFRWFYDYSGGQVTNTGAHYLDLIQWALNENAPRSVAAMGGKFADFDNREVPDTLEAMWTYDSGTLVTFSQFNSSAAPAAVRPCELEFRGTKGTLYFKGDSFEVVPESIPSREYPILSPLDRAGAVGWQKGSPMIEPKLVKGTKINPTVIHARNFLDCVRSRDKCNCDIETGHRSTSAVLIANIALKQRAMLDWDANAERFTNHEEANKLLDYTYRSPYELPKIG